MSLDLRVDFASYWTPAAATASFIAFLTWGIAGAYILLRRPRLAPAGWGMLYVWTLYFPELLVVRFQEPFVLYRSYFWAPGLAVIIGCVFHSAHGRMWTIVSIIALGSCAWQAHDRLRTFSSGLAVWEDAAKKLPASGVPGGYRTLYEVGREYLYAGRPGDALAATDKCMSLYPKTYDCYFGRAATHVELGEYEAALPYIASSIRLKPEYGLLHRVLGFALENLGCRDQARTEYRTAIRLGDKGAQHRLDAMDSPGKGLLPAQRAKPPATNCAQLAAVGAGGVVMQ